MVIKKLNEIFVPGDNPAVAVSKLGDAFAAKGWRFETKDLTPELADFADSYLNAVCENAGHISTTARIGCCRPTGGEIKTMLGWRQSIIL
jgi:hypothetical protein